MASWGDVVIKRVEISESRLFIYDVYGLVTPTPCGNSRGWAAN